VPSAATIRRVVLGVDPDLLDAVLSAWVGAREPDRATDHGLVCLAVDGKSARGARRDDGRAVHLVAAVNHATGVVHGQVAVDAKSNEITAFEPLLDPLDLKDVVLTADAMHTQDAHAKYLHRRGAHYVLIVKANRPTLARELASLPWQDVKAAFTCTNTGHGRIETRSIKVVRPPRQLSFPHAPAGHRPAPVAPNPGRQDRDRDRLRSHRPRLQPGNPSPARPDHPRALEHRKLRAPCGT
jgi:predicted transposase YbfD/YdcC